MKSTVAIVALLSCSLVFAANGRGYAQDAAGGGAAADTSPAPSPQTPSPEVKPPADAPLDSADLNRAFVLTPDECAAAIAKGREAAKKGTSFSDLMRDVIQQPRG